MADGLNRVLLLGNLGQDPDLRFGAGGDKAVLSFSMATSSSWFDKESNARKEETEWHRVVIFGKRGEALQKVLRKGERVCIEGRLHTSSYEKDGVKTYSTQVIASNVVLCGGGSRSGAADAARAPAATDAPPVGKTDDIPF